MPWTVDDSYAVDIGALKTHRVKVIVEVSERSELYPGERLAGAKVTVWKDPEEAGTRGAEPILTGRTDSNGEVVFADVPEGRRGFCAYLRTERETCGMSCTAKDVLQDTTVTINPYCY